MFEGDRYISTDIQLDGDEAPGLSGQFQIQVQCGLSNMNVGGQWDALQMTLYLVFVNEGTFTITGTGSAQHQLGVLSKMDILEAQKRPGVNYRQIQEVNGGDFLDSLGQFGSRINDFLKSTKILGEIGSYVPFVGPSIKNIANNLGYGYEAEGGCMTGGVAVQGGRHMSKAQLRKNLLNR